MSGTIVGLLPMSCGDFVEGERLLFRCWKNRDTTGSPNSHGVVSSRMRTILNVLYNCHWVIPGEAARSAQPYLGFWEHHLQSNGIRSLVNLRGAHPGWGWWQKEAQCCQRLRIAHFNLSMNSRILPTRALLLDLLWAFDAAPRPLLIKCSGGQDRTSFASALYLLHKNGWAAREAAAYQFRGIPYLHVPRQNQKWLRAFLDFALADASDASLMHWVRDRYDPVLLQQWLLKHGMGQSFLDMKL